MIRRREFSSLQTSESRFWHGLRTFFREQRPVVAERVEVEELEPGKHGIKRFLGYAQVIADVKDVILDLPLAELIRRDHVVGGKLADSPEILASVFFNQSGELHILGHAIAEL